MAATIVASSMVFIDGSVVNIALPVIQVDLHATVGQAQWVIQAYALFLSALILVGGSLGDHYGRRLMFLAGLIGFAIASVLCGISHNISELIAARGLQGIASALLTPGSLSLLTVSFDERGRGKAIGAWSSFTAITAAIGPALGGWIVQHASWRWIFFINIPLAIVVLAVTLRWVGESHDREKVHHIDWLGAALATAGLGGIVYGLIAESETGWRDAVVIGSLAVGTIALVAFLVVEARTRSPMMPLSLFRSRNFAGTNLLTFLLYAALGGMLFFLPFNLIQVQHYSPTAAGLAFLPFVLLLFVLSPWAGGLVRSVGPKLPLVVGPLLAGAGFVGFALLSIGGSYWTTFFPFTVLLGLGMAITVAPLTTTVMGSVDEDHVGVASGVNNAVARTGGLIAIAVLNVLVVSAFNRALDERVAALALPASVSRALAAERPKLAAAQPPAAASTAQRAALQRAIADSYVAAFRLAMLVAAALAFASALSAATIIRKPARGDSRSGGLNAPSLGAAGTTRR